MEKHTQITALAIQKMGGPVSAARLLRVRSYQTVQQWKLIPARYCISVETTTGISRCELRPDDWQDYWPELASQQKEAASNA